MEYIENFGAESITPREQPSTRRSHKCDPPIYESGTKHDQDNACELMITAKVPSISNGSAISFRADIYEIVSDDRKISS